MILPPKTIGMLGGGQLGRMTAMAARRMGYQIITLDPDPQCPASFVCDDQIVAKYDDESALQKLARQADVITLEFENISVEPLKKLESKIHPNWKVLEICQSREREKKFLKQSGYPHTEFRIVSGADELKKAVQELKTPCVLKSSEFGYDGKGQIKITSNENLECLWNDFGYSRGVVEAWVDYQAELSVICARNERGEITAFPIAENQHRNHILDVCIVPGRFDSKTLKEATELGRAITGKLDVVGLLAVELFLTRDGKILVNEMAPRPHNSGHYSFDACLTSQFEQHARAVCGLGLGDTKLLSPVVMVNLLGDVWPNGNEPDWSVILSHPQAKLHLYQKAQARPGRKMGHFCVLGETAEKALSEALGIQKKLFAAI
jgi:5-(carboxyamino)imidazole ribonucleotide synthase